MASNPIGVVVITRHGDREGFYQDPTTYTATGTTITPLGTAQEWQSGTGIRARYLDPSSPNYIQGISSYVPDMTQLDVRADAGDEGGVILDSAYAFFQGLYPANSTSSSVTLANGTTVVSPLGGYTYVPIQTIPAGTDVSLEGFTDCPTFSQRNTAFYTSPGFLAVQQQAAPFLVSLEPIVGPNRSVTLQNMWNIFDFMNVQNIHNATFHNLVTPNIMEQVRALANYHEYGVFTDTTPSGIGNIAGQTFIAPVLEALGEFQNASSPLRMQYLGISYKPFLSLFNMTDVDNQGIVDYASVLTLEVRNTSSGYTIRAAFRNGTATTLDGSDLQNLNLFNSGMVDYPLANFTANLEPYSISELTTWCTKCNQTSLRGCDTALAAQAEMNTTSSGSGSKSGAYRVSPPMAGMVGGVVAVLLLHEVFATFALAMWALLLGGKRKRASSRVAECVAF